jgi:HSP90 family molecular chaperone
MTQRGRVHFSKEDIGGEILPILTRGLYRDTLDSLREYIQNSIDAEAHQIHVFIDPDVVSIVDDGSGMNATEARKAIRLGISEKNPPFQRRLPWHRHI